MHKHNPRREKQLIALNVATIPKDRIESELFSHEKGLFSGAAALLLDWGRNTRTRKIKELGIDNDDSDPED